MFPYFLAEQKNKFALKIKLKKTASFDTDFFYSKEALLNLTVQKLMSLFCFCLNINAAVRLGSENCEKEGSSFKEIETLINSVL